MNEQEHYLVNLSTRELEHEGSRASCAAKKCALERHDVRTNDAYAQRVVVTGLTREEFEEKLHEGPWAFHEYTVEGRR